MTAASASRPRSAARTYCQLLVLRRADFDRFMHANPEVRETIHRVAAARHAANISDTDASERSPV